jgi:hypothetical protein
MADSGTADDGAADVSTMLRLSSPPAFALLVLFVGGNAALAVATLGIVHHAAPTVAALVLLLAGAVLLTTPARGRLPWVNIVIILVLVAVITALVSWNLPTTVRPGYASWHWGANTVLLFFLVLRGRGAAAWAGFAVMSLVTLAWAVDTGRGPASLLQYLPNHAGTLLLAVFVSWGLGRTGRRIAALHRNQAESAAAEARATAAGLERATQAAYLNNTARPALERIAAGAPYSDSERAQWLRLEATIRDSLRAFVLRDTALAAAATRARERGVEVALLDDSEGNITPDAERAVVSAMVAELDRMRSGQFTGRVLPAGRDRVATIVIHEQDDTRRVDV